ncbi:hypothetical protein SAMN03080601_03419 [Alkalitalea saponilacus]|uniref:Uncharacterized protein n=1 Tax=Alkalitalea saponilacus TaxID=889453 RepID=A0A1T5HTY8_9BACT|nr:hypothetical protein SAMN03080601_03419 [Alkalitalea saponilacus]
MGKKKCDTDKTPKQKDTHKFSCKRCGHFAKKKERLCQAEKLKNIEL